MNFAFMRGWAKVTKFLRFVGYSCIRLDTDLNSTTEVLLLILYLKICSVAEFLFRLYMVSKLENLCVGLSHLTIRAFYIRSNVLSIFIECYGCASSLYSFSSLRITFSFMRRLWRMKEYSKEKHYGLFVLRKLRSSKENSWCLSRGNRLRVRGIRCGWWVTCKIGRRGEWVRFWG
jgi:hypothetical protein